MKPDKQVRQQCSLNPSLIPSSINSISTNIMYCCYAPARVNNHAVAALVDSGNMWRSAFSDVLAHVLGLQLNRLKPVHPKVVGTALKDRKLIV